MTQTIPIAKARSELSSLLDAAERQHEHIVITRNGTPAAVMISSSEYESLCETLEIAQDLDLMQALSQSERDIRTGDVEDWDAIKKSRRA